jgi:hypothetical protein
VCLAEHLDVGSALQTGIDDVNSIVSVACEHTSEVALKRLVDEQLHAGRGSVA